MFGQTTQLYTTTFLVTISWQPRFVAAAAAPLATARATVIPSTLRVAASAAADRHAAAVGVATSVPRRLAYGRRDCRAAAIACSSPSRAATPAFAAAARPRPVASPSRLCARRLGAAVTIDRASAATTSGRLKEDGGGERMGGDGIGRGSSMEFLCKYTKKIKGQWVFEVQWSCGAAKIQFHPYSTNLWSSFANSASKNKEFVLFGTAHSSW